MRRDPILELLSDATWINLIEIQVRQLPGRVITLKIFRLVVGEGEEELWSGRFLFYEFKPATIRCPLFSLKHGKTPLKDLPRSTTSSLLIDPLRAGYEGSPACQTGASFRAF